MPNRSPLAAAILTGASIAGHVLSWSFDDPTRATGHGAAFFAIDLNAMMPGTSPNQRRHWDGGCDRRVLRARSAGGSTPRSCARRTNAPWSWPATCRSSTNDSSPIWRRSKPISSFRGATGLASHSARSTAEAARAPIRERIIRGELKRRGFPDGVKVAKVSAETVAAYDPDGLLLVNVNTPHDYERAKQVLEGRSKTSRDRIMDELGP